MLGNSEEIGRKVIWKDFLKYEEMRKYFIICEEALVMYDFDPIPPEFPYIYEEIYFSFLTV
jgi:hypothetical protein